MLPTEHLRNKNQRLIPLTAELIQDMLDHEGLEYQTPPGGNISESVGDAAARSQLVIQSPSLLSTRRANRKGNASASISATLPDEVTHSTKSLHSLYKATKMRKKKVLAKLKSLAKKEKTSPLICFMQKVRSKCSPDLTNGQLLQHLDLRLDNIQNGIDNIENMIKSDRKTASSRELTDDEELSSNALMCIKKVASFNLFSSSSDSPHSKQEPRNRTMEHYKAMYMQHVNMMVLPKSLTSFNLNRHKLFNHVLASCNDHYTSTEADLKRDYAAASYLASSSRHH